MDKIDGVDVELAISETLRNQITALTPGSIRFNNVLRLNWRNRQAVQRVYQTAVVVGRLPDLYDSEVGGQAVWLYVKSKVRDQYFDEFIIRDLAYLHTRPGLHADYFSISITMPLKVGTVEQLIHLTESTTYNRVNQRLTAGCHFRGASIVTFYVVARLDSQEITIEEARSIYSQLIPQALKEFQEVEQSVDMRSVSTPITDTLEKYVFGKANTKLATYISGRRTGIGTPVTQREIMMTEASAAAADTESVIDIIMSETDLAGVAEPTTEFSRPAEAAVSTSARSGLRTVTFSEPLDSGPAASIRTGPRLAPITGPRLATPTGYK